MTAADQASEGHRGGRPRPTRTLLRGLAVLDAIADAGRALGPTEIGGIIGLDKGTVSRLLLTLDEAGYLRRDPLTRTYALSTKVLRLSRGFSGRLDLRDVARSHLRQLCDDVGETVHLGVRDGADVVYVDKVEARNQSIRMVSAIGQAMPLHTTALGKAMLSRYPSGLRDEVLAKVHFEPRSERSITDRSTMLEHLRVSRERGYAIDDRENEDLVTCVGAAILGVADEVLGALSISSPSFRVQGRVEELGEQCRDVARVISRALGGETDTDQR